MKITKKQILESLEELGYWEILIKTDQYFFEFCIERTKKGYKVFKSTTNKQTWECKADWIFIKEEELIFFVKKLKSLLRNIKIV